METNYHRVTKVEIKDHEVRGTKWTTFTITYNEPHWNDETDEYTPLCTKATVTVFPEQGMDGYVPIHGDHQPDAPTYPRTPDPDAIDPEFGPTWGDVADHLDNNTAVREHLSRIAPTTDEEAPCIHCGAYGGEHEPGCSYASHSTSLALDEPVAAGTRAPNTAVGTDMECHNAMVGGACKNCGQPDDKHWVDEEDTVRCPTDAQAARDDK